MTANLDSGEFLPLMVEIARLMKPKVYVELGVRKGKTFQAIAPFAGYSAAVDVETGRIPELIRKENLRRSKFFRMRTDEFAEFWAREKRVPIDLLFIDADHRKEQVLKDFDNFAPLVRKDTGLIILHDTLPASPELLSPGKCCNAWAAAWEIRTAERYRGFEIVTLPGNWVGLSIVRKAEKQLFWKTE